MLAPSTIFAVPSQDEIDNNRLYWTGYADGQMADIPSAAGYMDYWLYRADVEKHWLPKTEKGYVNNYNVGYDMAIVAATNWSWQNDPNSGHNKSS
jgi:hypothetical protein